MTAGALLPQRLLKQANIADTVILLPFAVPLVAAHYIRFWAWLDEAFGGSGLPDFEPDHLVFVNLAGAFAVLGVTFRAQSGTVEAARSVGLFKLVVTVIFAVALFTGAARIFAVPLLADLVTGVALLILAQTARSNTKQA